MFSVAAIFETKNLALWDEMESRCIHSGLEKTMIHHFSWQTAESYEFDLLRESLRAVCNTIQPFRFHTAGLGIFPNPRKILFLIIAKDQKLMDLHKLIWDETARFASGMNPLYAPENWIPHISLNLNDLLDDQFNCAVEKLSNISLTFEFTVDEFSLLYLTPTSSGIDSTFKLQENNLL